MNDDPNIGQVVHYCEPLGSFLRRCGTREGLGLLAPSLLRKQTHLYGLHRDLRAVGDAQLRSDTL